MPTQINKHARQKVTCPGEQTQNTFYFSSYDTQTAANYKYSVNVKKNMEYATVPFTVCDIDTTSDCKGLHWFQLPYDPFGLLSVWGLDFSIFHFPIFVICNDRMFRCVLEWTDSVNKYIYLLG